MGKKIISMFMTVLLLYGFMEPALSAGFAWAASSSTAVAGVETRNVALGAQVTASGQCNSNEGPGFAVDGKTDTKWCDNTNAKIK